MAGSKLVQFLLAAVLLFGLFTALQSTALGRAIILAMAVAAMVFGAFIWVLRYSPRRVLGLYRWPAGRSFIQWLCGVSGEQLPDAACRTPDFDPLEHSLRLKTPEDFRALDDYLRQHVRGQDTVIGLILQQLDTSIRARRRSMASDQLPPLAAILLAGPEGCGKRYLAHLASSGVFQECSLAEFDFSAPDTAQFLIEEMMETTRRHPFSCFILKHVSRSSLETQQLLAAVVTHGSPLASPRGGNVGMQNCILFFIETLSSQRVDQLVHKGFSELPPGEVRHEIQWFQGLLDGIELALLCPSLEPAIAAEVALLLLQQECAKHQRPLHTVSPEVVANLAILILEDGPGRARTALVNVVKRAISDPAAARGPTSVHVGARHMAQIL